MHLSAFRLIRMSLHERTRERSFLRQEFGVAPAIVGGLLRGLGTDGQGPLARPEPARKLTAN